MFDLLSSVNMNRYGNCLPFSNYPTAIGIPCDSVYEIGTDYVYIRNGNETLEVLNAIGEI